MLTCYKHTLCCLAMLLILAQFPEREHLFALPLPGPGAAGGSQISCSPATPVAELGSAVRLRAFVSPAQQELRYSWTAAVGKLQGSNSHAVWLLNGVLSGRYQATVAISSGGRSLGECSLQLIVVEAQRSAAPSRESARTFLMKDHQDEEPGYGLYSYLLFGSPPTESDRKRYLNAIQAYLKLLLPLGDLEDNVAHSKLNVTYFPVKTIPPSSPNSEWLLENYDFARARILLDLLPGNHRQGPYFISALGPLTSATSLPRQYLFQDLSQVPIEPNDLLSWWVLEFENQAAQERFWEPPTGEHLALRLRTTISALAAGLPEVQEQLHAWIVWVKGA